MGQYSKLLRHIIRQRVLPRESRILIGVSGGSDSMALLELLQEGAQRNHWKLAIAHVDHDLRGRASAEDARWIKAEGKRRGLKVHSRRVDVAAVAKAQPGTSIEMAARRLRYQFFADLVKRHKYDCVALGHTQDDQAETVLLNLLRGAGPDGLSGMDTVACRAGLLIVRPLLSVPKDELRELLRRRGVEWREDATNSDPSFMRNRVRTELLPLLSERFNPQIVNALARAATNLRYENTALREQTEADLDGCRIGTGRALDLRVLRKLSEARQSLAVRRWLQEQCSDQVPTPTSSDLSQVLSICATTSGSAAIPLGWGRVKRAYHRLSFVPGPKTGSSQYDDFVAKLRKPGITLLDQFNLTVAIESATGYAREPGHGIGVWPITAYISARYVGRAALHARTWRPGDRFHPVGGARRKVQDIFTDSKIPRDLRNRIPLLVCRDEILWIPGHRVAAAAAVEHADALSWRICMEANG